MTIKTLNGGGAQADQFTLHIDDGAGFSVAASTGAVSTAVSAGSHQVKENLESFYSLSGYSIVDAVNGDVACPAQEQSSAPLSIDVTVDGQHPNVGLCLYNNAFGDMHLALVNIGGAPADQFTLDWGGGFQSLLSASALSSQRYWVGPESITPSPKAGYTYLGWAFGEVFAGTCPPAGQALPGAFNHNLGQEIIRVCFYYQADPASGGSIGVKTVNKKGSAADQLNAALDGGGAFVVSTQTAAVQAAALGAHTVSEDSSPLNPLAFYEYDGYAVVPGPADAFDCPASATSSGDAQVALTPNNPTAGVCLYNSGLGQLGIRKVNIGGNQGDSFTAKINNGSEVQFSAASGTWSGVDTGDYLVHELSAAGYTYLGWAFGDQNSCPAADQGHPADSRVPERRAVLTPFER